MSNRLPPLPALRSFEALSRLGSVNAAADEMCGTHGAVSHQVRALEEHLDVQLIKRGSRPLALTEEGRNYAYQVRQALDDIAEATGRLMVRSANPLLTISVLPSFAMFWLIPRLPGFLQAQPKVRLSLVASMAFSSFDSEPAACAVRFGHGQWPVPALRAADAGDESVGVLPPLQGRRNPDCSGRHPRMPIAACKRKLVDMAARRRR